MRHLIYFAFCIALAFFNGGAESASSPDPKIVGGASHECYRECVAGDTRICYYEFTVSEWLSMSDQCGDCPYTEEDCYSEGCVTAGGHVRTVAVVNHMLPGPSIQVCRGDIIRVKVINKHGSESTTIHWHGLSHVDTPYMDGVPFLTQCPILSGNSFVYNFTADPPGTHMWHSHFGFQETDGLHGSLIIREPDDVAADYYDYDLPEHIMVVWHWYNMPTAHHVKVALLQSSMPTAYSFTVNGLAKTLAYTKNDEDYYTPRANFRVTQGYRYRFRVIGNSGVYCPVQVSIDNHTLTMIATDGATFEPVEVDTFMLNAGERYDFVLTADQEVGNYWIRYRGIGAGCTTVSSVAILNYDGAAVTDPSGTTNYDDAYRSGVLLNPIGEANTDYSDNTLIRISDLNNTMSKAPDVTGTPDLTFYIPFSMNKYADYETPGPYAQCDNISFTLPPVPPLTQYDEITSDMYCTQDNTSAKVCDGDYCTCPLIYNVPTNKLAEVILFDTTSSWTDDHPIHFHGHYLRVVAIQPGNSTILTRAELQAMNEAGLIEKKLENAPLKDTFGVPARGFIVLRVLTDHPGYWLAHCHVAAHFEEGMGLAFKVGENSEMPQAPPGFPKCSGNYDITKSSS